MIDYESESLSQDSIKIKNEGKIYQNKESIEFIPNNEDSNNKGEKLIEILSEENSYKLKFNQFQIDDKENISTHNSAWFLLRKNIMSPRLNTYQLNEGDIIKIAKISFLVRTIKFHNINLNEDEDKKKNELQLNKSFSNTLYENNENKKKEEESGKVCKICYNEEDTDENPLIHPCECTGSLKYIHLNCLRYWLSTSICTLIDSNDDYSIYNFKQLKCKLCQKKFPDYILHNSKLYEILDLHTQINYNSFMILESLTLDNLNNNYFYIISLDNKEEIDLGRAHESNIRISDISVSRHHCTFSVNKKAKKVFIHDNNSRCGTLILIQSPSIKLIEDMTLNIQIGSTYFEILNTNFLWIFNCCNASEKSNEDCYYIQNVIKNNNLRKLKFKTACDFEEENEKNSKCSEKVEENININNNAQDRTVFNKKKDDIDEINIDENN